MLTLLPDIRMPESREVIMECKAPGRIESGSVLILPIPKSFVSLYESPFNLTLVDMDLKKIIPPLPKKTLIEEVINMAEQALSNLDNASIMILATSSSLVGLLIIIPMLLISLDYRDSRLLS